MNHDTMASKARSGWIIPAFLLVWSALSVCPPVLGEDQESITVLKRMGDAFASVAEKASPGVVGIVARRKVSRTTPSVDRTPFSEPSDPFSEDFWDYFFRRSPRQQRPQREYTQRAQGSGFIISKDGYILTNNHVVGGADEVQVELREGHTVEAEIVGADPESDVAVIKVNATGLTPVAMGDSEALQVGEWVLAIGSPLGLSHTVTAGIVSATGRSGLNIATYENFIQTDAAINMGNSGGPLINLNGEAVGINTAIVGPTGGNIGIGFAIPINMAKDVANQLMKTGSVERGYLGVYPQDLTPELAEALGIPGATGVVISQVTENSAAAQAGLQRGDVVQEFNGVKIESATQFRNLVARRKPGEEVEVVVLRNGNREMLTVTMGRRPSIEELRGEQPQPQRPAEEPQRLGLSVQDITPELAERYGLGSQTGVIITRVAPGSEAVEKGLRAGYVIAEVNRRPVHNVSEFRDAVTEALDKGRVLLLVTDGRVSQYVVLTHLGE
jgi:serine protease Do